MARIAITGGAGVIGRELIARLVKRGDRVLSLDREPLSPPLASQLEHVRADLSEAGMEAIEAFRPEAVIHLAAAFERSTEEPGFWETNWRDNVLVTHRLHDLLRRLASVRSYVFASSYLIYRPDLYLFDSPPANPRALREDDAVLPRNLCGAAKYLGEREIDFLRNVRRVAFRSVSARIYRVYGCGSRDGWVRALLRNKTIDVYNPDNRFDYIFAGDVAEGLIRLADSSQASGVVNLATGQAKTIRDVIDVMSLLMNQTASLVRERSSNPPFEASTADLTRLRAWTGWIPITDLASGIAKLIEHEQQMELIC